MQIYDGSENFKVDEDGRSYLGVSLKELKEYQENEKPQEIHNSEKGIV